MSLPEEAPCLSKPHTLSVNKDDVLQFNPYSLDFCQLEVHPMAIMTSHVLVTMLNRWGSLPSHNDQLFWGKVWSLEILRPSLWDQQCLPLSLHREYPRLERWCFFFPRWHKEGQRTNWTRIFWLESTHFPSSPTHPPFPSLAEVCDRPTLKHRDRQRKEALTRVTTFSCLSSGPLRDEDAATQHSAVVQRWWQSLSREQRAGSTRGCQSNTEGAEWEQVWLRKALGLEYCGLGFGCGKDKARWILSLICSGKGNWACC